MIAYQCANCGDWVELVPGIDTFHVVCPTNLEECTPREDGELLNPEQMVRVVGEAELTTRPVRGG